MPYKISSFDDLTLPEYIERGDTQSMGDALAASDFVQLPGGGFYDNYGELDSPRLLSPVTKQSVIYNTGGDTVREQVEELRAKLGKRGRLETLWHDGVVRWLWARCIKVAYPRGFNTRLLHIPVNLTFAPGGGVWYADEQVQDDTVFATSTMSEDIVIDNPGNVNVTDPIIQFKSPFAGVLTITIENYETSQKVVMEAGVAIDDTMILDVGKRTARLHKVPVAIDTISRSGNVITVNCDAAHGLSVDDLVAVRGTSYDEFYTVATVVDADTVTLTADPHVKQPHGPESPVAGLLAEVDDFYPDTIFSDKADWFWLVPGENTIHLTADEDMDGGTFSVIYNPTYA